MKRILITGGSGFIGHHVIEHILKTTDWEIVSLDRLSVSGNYNRLSDLDCWEQEKHRLTFVHHDLRSPVNRQVEALIGEVEYILHMAASTHVDRSITDPMSFVLDNVVATTNLLEFAKLMNHSCSHEKKIFEHFIYFSTDEVFGPAPDTIKAVRGYDDGEDVRFDGFREWDRYNSANPYAAAKAGGEEMCLAYANTYKIPMIITHTMNVFGERQHPEKFIPMTIRKILAGETIIIHSDKTKTKAGSRMWIHARNVAAAILFLLQDVYKDKAPFELADKFNVVGEKEMDNLAMAQFIFDTICKLDPGTPRKFDYEMVDFHSSRPGHDLRYALDGSKMESLGWSLPVDFEHSLAQVIEWSIKNNQWLK